MTKEKMTELIEHYAKVRKEADTKNPRPEETDEEKESAQKELVGIMNEMKPLRSNANKKIL